jgi:hypothetical protein
MSGEYRTFGFYKDRENPCRQTKKTYAEVIAGNKNVAEYKNFAFTAY